MSRCIEFAGKETHNPDMALLMSSHVTVEQLPVKPTANHYESKLLVMN